MNEIMDLVNQQIVHIKELETRLAEAERLNVAYRAELADYAETVRNLRKELSKTHD